MARYTSPPGTFEAVRKEVLEDPTWHPAAFRVALYLVTKPDGWVIRDRQVADATGLSKTAVAGAIRDLRAQGLVVDTALIKPVGGVAQGVRLCRRGLTVARPG